MTQQDDITQRAHKKINEIIAKHFNDDPAGAVRAQIVVHEVLSKRRAPVADERKNYCPEKRKPGGCQLHNLHCGYPKCNEAPTADTQEVPQDTGNPEADRLIGRLMSSDPDFDDCAAAARLIRDLASAPVAGEARELAEALREWHGKGDGITTTIPDELAQALYGYLYAAPQASEAVRDQALAALQSAQRFIRNGIEFGYVRMPDADTPDPAHRTPDLIDAAIRALSAQPGAQRTGGSE